MRADGRGRAGPVSHDRLAVAPPDIPRFQERSDLDTFEDLV